VDTKTTFPNNFLNPNGLGEIKMSEFDEMDLDQEELDMLGSPDDLTPEEVFSMVMINKVRMKKVKVHLEDEDGDPIDLTDIIVELMGYMKDKIEEEDGNQFSDQIMPLISQSVVSCLGRMIGINATAFHLSQDTTRHAVIWFGSLAFLFYKYIQMHNLKIYTTEEDVSSDEIDEIERKTEANKIAMMGMIAGANPKEILRQLKEEGKLTDNDLKDMLGEDENDINKETLDEIDEDE